MKNRLMKKFDVNIVTVKHIHGTFFSHHFLISWEGEATHIWQIALLGAC
jgi:hypothetical protein